MILTEEYDRKVDFFFGRSPLLVWEWFGITYSYSRLFSRVILTSCLTRYQTFETMNV